MKAKERLHAAVDAAGPGLSDILWRVVCAGEGDAGRRNRTGLARARGKVVLTLALDRAADYYRLK